MKGGEKSNVKHSSAAIKLVDKVDTTTSGKLVYIVSGKVVDNEFIPDN